MVDVSLVGEVWLRVLVVYGTRWGGTVGVAEKIADALRKADFVVNVVNARKSPTDIDAYDLVIVGSGIRADKWTKETLKFLEENAAVLRGKKTALFVSCQMADREEEAREKAKDAYLVKIAEQYWLRPVSFGFFGGLMDFKKSHGLLVDIIVRVNGRNLRKNGLDTRRVLDTRDWEQIEAWALEVAGAVLEKR